MQGYEISGGGRNYNGDGGGGGVKQKISSVEDITINLMEIVRSFDFEPFNSFILYLKTYHYVNNCFEALIIINNKMRQQVYEKREKFTKEIRAKQHQQYF